MAHVNTTQRLMRMTPTPVKAAGKRVLEAADPLVVARYRRRSGHSGPLPPGDLRARCGSPFVADFVRGGAQAASDLGGALEGAGRSFSTSRSVLDFGCGCGRVAAHVHERAGAATKISGSDVDAPAIAWDVEHLGWGDFRVNRAEPPLPYEDASFDVVYSISIFTHLDERRQDAWLAEIARVLEPGGVALLSIHGPTAFHEFATGAMVSNSPSCAQRMQGHHDLEAERLVHEPYEINAFNARGFPGVDDAFGIACHSHAYVREHWSAFLDVDDVLPQAIDGWQDLVVARRPAG